MKNWVMASAAALALVACGGGSSGGSGGGGGGGGGAVINSPPSFSPPSAVDFEERDSGGEVVALSATDPDGDTITFSIASGKDGDLFTIDSSNNLAFQNLPSFETPQDEDGDNVYEVDVIASDGTAGVTGTIAVTVTNNPEGVQLVNRGVLCPGSRGKGLIRVDDFELGIVCENGEVKLFDSRDETNRLWVDTRADLPGETLSSGFFYDAFFRRVFFVSTNSTGFSLHSYTYDNSLGTRDLTYETRVLQETPSSLEFFSSAMQDCLNNELCLMVGAAGTGNYVNEITAFTLTDPMGNLAWTESTLQTGLSWGGDMKRREREFFVSTVDNATINRYEFDGGAFTEEVALGDFPQSSIRSIAYYDGNLSSISPKLLTGIADAIYTIDSSLLFDGSRDDGSNGGIEDRSLDLTPDSGTLDFVGALLRLGDSVFVLDTFEGELFEITAL